MIRFIILSLAATLTLASCKNPELSAVSPGQPESLIDMSSERVSMPVQTQDHVDQIIQFIESDQPTKADIQCNPSINPFCSSVQQALSLYGVPSRVMDSSQDNITLIYERVIAKACDNRFVSNHHNLRNMNYPGFGCSVATNIVQHVSDRSQFTDPALMDLPDAENAVNVYDKYYLGKF